MTTVHIVLIFQGAGGNGNVLKELVEPKGALIDLAAIPSGDPTLSGNDIFY